MRISPYSVREVPEDQRHLLKACKDFEAVFLTILWREMNKSTNTKLGGWGVLVEQGMGTKWAESGGIGLAEVMFKQMSNTSPK